jgi:hypothetical protein
MKQEEIYFRQLQISTREQTINPFVNQSLHLKAIAGIHINCPAIIKALFSNDLLQSF